MKYAIIQLGGKQLKVMEGERFNIERQKALNVNVLAYSNGEETFIGNPYLSDVKLSILIDGEKLGKKVSIVRFKAKSRHKRKVGHRQPLSVVKVGEILRDGEVARVPKSKDEESAEKTKKVVKRDVVLKKPVKKATSTVKKIKRETK